jgi:hypothetical protein
MPLNKLVRWCSISDPMMRHRLLTTTVLLALAIPLLLAEGAGALGSGGGSWVNLDGGRNGRLTWVVAAGGSCLRVGTTWRTGPLSFLRQRSRACVRVGARRRASQPPVIARATQPSDGAAAKMTAVGALVPRAVDRLEVTFQNGTTREFPLHSVSPRQAHATRLGRYRYAAFVVDGPWCTERIVTFNAAGRALWDSGIDEYPCV